MWTVYRYKEQNFFFLIFIFGVKEPYSWSLKSLKQESVAKIVRPHEELNPPSNQDLQGSVCTQQDKFGNGIFTLKINFLRLNCRNAEKKSTKTTNCDLTSIINSKFMHALQAYTYSQPTAMWVMYLQRTTHVSHLSLLYNDLLRRESHFRPQRPPSYWSCGQRNGYVTVIGNEWLWERSWFIKAWHAQTIPRNNTDISVQREGGLRLKKRRKAKFKYLCQEKITSH